jgi:prevent-host-death family protein
MSSVGIYEAKTHFSELIARVAAGETIEITRHGKAVAWLAPASGAGANAAGSLEEEFVAFAAGHTLGGLTLRELIDEGRRIQ